MAIYPPSLLLTDDDREVLALLAQLVLTSEEGGGRNLLRGEIALSPHEAHRLLVLLEQFVSSKLFLEGSYFTEQLANGEGLTNVRLKEIYLSWRSRRGRTRVASTYTWHEFTVRSGLVTSKDAWIWPQRLNRSPVRPMLLSHFVAMERKLTNAAGLHPRVANLVMEFVESALPYVDKIREMQASVEPGTINSFVKEFINDLHDHTRGQEKLPMSRKRVIGLSTIIMDTAALFATRDWTTAGVLSSLAAVAPDALGYKFPVD